MITWIKCFKIVVWGYDDEYEINNVPNYDLFNKHVLIFKKKLKQLNLYIQFLLQNGPFINMNIHLLKIIWKRKKDWLKIHISIKPVKISMMKVFWHYEGKKTSNKLNFNKLTYVKDCLDNKVQIVLNWTFIGYR